MWVPSHRGIAFNEEADKLAKQALLEQEVTAEVKLFPNEGYTKMYIG